MAEWLNSAFAGLDGGVFSAMHGLAEVMGGVLTPIMKIITLLGEKGLIFFLAGVILMLFPKTRKLGVCIFGAVACGALITNIIIKDTVERIRPFETNAEFRAFWEYIGSPKEDGFCFPSGHVTAITAAATALFILCNKKWSWVGFIGVIFMGFARIYLIHHYFTDVIAGIIVGAISGVLAFFITKLIFYLLNKYPRNRFCSFCLNFNIAQFFGKKPVQHTNYSVGKIVVGDNNFNGKAEGFERLKDNILYINADKNVKVIQIASSVAHEGKTTVVANLAVSLGLTDKKVVVVDTDFRRPRLHRIFGIHIEDGLSDFVLGTKMEQEVIKSTKYKNVDIVTRGAKVYNPSLVMVSEKFKNFIKELREKYDYVLIDCAPILSVSDYIHILSVSDGVLFVVAYGITARTQVASAIKELRQNKANILGDVFTMYDKKKDSYYHGYGHGYYGYYKNYGVEEKDETSKT